MSGNRRKLKGRREGGSFGRWPHACAVSPTYAKLSFTARALLLEFVGQFNGFNNGDLTAAFEVLKSRGWNSRTTVDKAAGELEETGWIVRTRQGGKNRCNLFALTFAGIDACNDKHGNSKLDVAPNPVALGFWKDGRNPWCEREKQQRPRGNGIISKPRLWATLAQNMGKSQFPAPENDTTMPRIWASQVENSPSPCPESGHLKDLPWGDVDSVVAVDAGSGRAGDSAKSKSAPVRRRRLLESVSGSRS